tara:strand:- start:489 stop:662 length:174 start_codon:yes stop_codon:yes gene_type:complete
MNIELKKVLYEIVNRMDNLVRLNELEAPLEELDHAIKQASAVVSFLEPWLEGATHDE